MILALFIAIPLACGIVAWATGRLSSAASRWITLIGNAATLAIAVTIWAGAAYAPGAARGAGSGGALAIGTWLIEMSVPWIPRLGISFTLAADGLSLMLLALTSFLGITSVLASWKGIQDKVPFFHFNISLVLAGINGVFLALDLFLFAFFWELMLIPMYLIIDIWGHESRHHAAVKFFLFTQVGGLLMFVSIVGLSIMHGRSTGIYTFDYRQLIGTALSPAAGMLLMLGFFAAFAVKLPAFPLHAWLPDAHTQAPTAGSVILAGLLLKTGAYGLIRFILPLFPEAARSFAPVGTWMGIAGILYGGLMAFSQTDLKRLVAYTSISHLGFVLLGVFSLNAQAISGAVVQMLSHGLSTGALFILVGSLQDRLHTRDLNRMGGLWVQAPRMGAMALVLTMALLGLPGFGNFIGEFLVLLGSYQAAIALAVVAGIGLIIAMVYSLRMFGMAFHGTPRETWHLPDLTAVEMTALCLMIVALLWLGLFPQGALSGLTLEAIQ